MSRLTNCCACDAGCEPEQLYWREPGQPLPTGPAACTNENSVFYGFPPQEERYEYLDSGCSGLRVTSETTRNVLLFDVFVEGDPAGVFRQAPSSFSTELRLWCDEHGENPQAKVRIIGTVGEAIDFAAGDPETFTPIQDASAAGLTNCQGAKNYTLRLEIEAGGSTESAKMIAFPQVVPGGGSPFHTLGKQLAFQRARFTVVATRLNGECDAWVLARNPGDLPATAYGGYREGDFVDGLSTDTSTEFTRYGDFFLPLAESIVSGNDFRVMLRESVLHFFSPVQVADDGECGAVSATADSCVVTVRAMAYQTTREPALAVVPEDGELDCYCTPTGATGPAECFVDRTPEGGVSPANPYRYPWFISPCSHTRKSGHVTHAALSKNLSRLSVTLPQLESSGAFGATAYYVEPMLKAIAGAYELSPDIDGSPLIDNQFFLSAGGGASEEGESLVFGDRVFADIESVVLGASMRSVLVTNPLSSYTQVTSGWITLPPCSGAVDDWAAFVQLYVFVRGQQRLVDAESDALVSTTPFSFFLSGSICCGSDFYRGIEHAFDPADNMRSGIPVAFFGFPAEYHVVCFGRAAAGFGLTNGWQAITPIGATKLQLVE